MPLNTFEKMIPMKVMEPWEPRMPLESMLDAIAQLETRRPLQMFEEIVKLELLESRLPLQVVEAVVKLDSLEPRMPLMMLELLWSRLPLNKVKAFECFELQKSLEQWAQFGELP